MKETVLIGIDAKYVKVCSRCNETYVAKRSDSKTCGCRRPKPEELTERKCEVCSSEFKPKRRDSRYCSRKCGNKAENKRNAKNYRQRSKEWYSKNTAKAAKRRKEYYWKDPEKWRAKTREYTKLHKEQVRKADNDYKDKTRHDGKRVELIEEHGYKCSECKKEKEPFDIVAHHVTFDSQDHESQILLCRSCHAKLHRDIEYMNSLMESANKQHRQLLDNRSSVD